MYKYPLVALVGDSGVGKTELMIGVVKAMPAKVDIIKALRSRPYRDARDDLTTIEMEKEEIERLHQAGELTQFLRYAGNTYGVTRAEVYRVLEQKVGIKDLVETGVEDFRREGVEVYPVKIVADSTIREIEEERKLADRSRATVNLDYQLTVLNSFQHGGLNRSINDICRFIKLRCQTNGS